MLALFFYIYYYMKKTNLFEELSRMRQLAGLINESYVDAHTGMMLKLDGNIKNQVKSIQVPEEPTGNKMTNLPDDMLHVTLTSIKGFKPYKEQFSNFVPKTPVPEVRLGKGKFVYRENGDSEEKVQVWFDLDGVLADMQKALDVNSELQRLRGDLDNFINSTFPSYKGLSDDQIKLKFKSELELDPNNLGLKQLKRIFRDYNNYVFVIAGKHGFYANLELMPGAQELVKKAYEITGVKPNVLSSPAGDENDPTNPSVIEKRQWVKENFGTMINHVEITTDKARVAKGKKDILIDDRTKYVDVFINAGGSAILFTDYVSVIKELEQLYANLIKKVTYVVSIENQEEVKNFVDSVYKEVGLENPEPDRFFHITIANNKEGNTFKSIGDVTKADFS